MALKEKYDVALIGGGIMSATLGIMLKEFNPDLKIALFERLDAVAQESSSAWNNAGTGHSAFCELNYTPRKASGKIDLTKAEKIVEQFEISKQFWSFLVDKGYVDNPQEFIRSCPHMSLVFGEDDASFLKDRFDAMKQNHLFSDMQFSDDFNQIKEWLPLISEGRDGSEKLAVTRVDLGTEMNFGNLTSKMVEFLRHNNSIEIYTAHEVDDIDLNKDKTWKVEVENRTTKEEFDVNADFVFIGAGGYALPLLDSSDIDESDGYGGFPVSGEWLVCHNPEIVEKHSVKCYTKAAVNAPPMSVPHLDLRVIDGKKSLLFGPFASFSTKFLKYGKFLDLPMSIDFDNIPAMLGAWWHNLPLTKYLIKEVSMSKEDRLNELRRFVKNAKEEDWELKVAGQRVQIIKKDDDDGGKLQFGTEVVVNKNKTIASLLGASPGASTSVQVMLEVLEKCFGDKLQNEWKDKLEEMIPSYGKTLADEPELTQKLRNYTKEKLNLSY